MEQTYVGTVEKIIGKTGSRGGITQVRVLVELGNNKRSLLRNIKGPIKEKDKIVLMEADREARRIR